MSIEAYKVKFGEIATSVDPVARGDKPFLIVQPGTSDVAVTRIEADEKRTVLVFVCEEDNSESRIYTLDQDTILTRYGSGKNRRLLVTDDDADADFPLRHDKTLFPNSIPMYIRAVDDEGNDAWLMLKHV